MKFEYNTTFIPVAYEKEETGVWIFKKESLPISPNVSSLYDNESYARYGFKRLGISKCTTITTWYI
jgi:hypothetical protein